LAAVAAWCTFAHDKVRIEFISVNGRTSGEPGWIATELQLAVGQLQWNDFSVTLKQRDRDTFAFYFGEIGNGIHGL
jgi:hypothetical protein